ncbi:DUF6622 family protein [Massilia sp.]|uniref:DUF6622 family protein n=1 Tax=Massilia sp. TaxID=1882437 RepID=UPI00289EE18A|nr:DUF6622 family protein [Massilia sp.]
MSQILTHTPVHVWAILAGLIALGVSAMRDREMTPRRLAILPLAIVVLSLSDIGNKFGFGALSLGAWAMGCIAAVMLTMRFARSRIAASNTPGRVRVGGSVAPLAIMMAVFCTKYATAVMLALRPELAGAAQAVLGVCAVSGLFNGVLLGRMMRDLGDCRAVGLPEGSARIAA